MRDIIKKVPIPTAGVALGLAALGNLLQPYAEVAHIVCGALSLFLVAMIVAKVVLFPSMIRDDLQNSIFASVSATFFMTLMQLAGYLAPVAIVPAFGLWCAAIAGHFILMGWFTAHFIRRFKLAEVFPTYFICYVGIIVAAVTSPVFGMEAFGRGIFWFGLACFAVLLATVVARYLKHEIPEPARPLFCIFAAPMGLSLVGYLAVTPNPDPLFVGVLMGLGQVMLVGVATQLPKFIALKFYPSYAAMTFPFVISAMALGKGMQALYAAGVTIPALPMVEALIALETVFAAVMVTYVFVHYMRFFFGTPKGAKATAPAAEAPAVLMPEIVE
ncbi:TDT family transporter [Adlercreutzia muris]|uniref:TDT family transporter n=1 Tax=Adlercreutzia muris TaxID=1796610 RepID=A0A7C8FMF0_9ACTN|nr:TDT family transporter [Adlercreutzia muris]KAB1636664.1 TDT family transporter [Adlercreutzia muris]MCR2028312.1 TDT family transporter [Adlercreutzia muris]MCU7583943.1 TDT family transporter [Adlercreutzia muris]NCA32910.1 C4-dicarboxylate ABC transporter [Adlercreutzia muris]